MRLSVLCVVIMYWVYLGRAMVICQALSLWIAGACLEVLERVWDWLGMGLWRIVGAVLSWDDEDYRRLCCLTWSTWGGVRWLGSRWRRVTLGVG